MTDRTPPQKWNRDTLSDSAFLAWALVEAFRVFIGHVRRRWPEINDVR